MGQIHPMPNAVPGLVFFSSGSGNTARFIAKLDLPAQRIPMSPKDEMPHPAGPYILVVPTFADGQGRGAVPKQVIHFLNDPARRAGIRGVIAGGNRNFGTTFALGGRVVAEKCNVPVLYKFELSGNDLDVDRVKTGLEKFWGNACLTL